MSGSLGLRVWQQLPRSLIGGCWLLPRLWLYQQLTRVPRCGTVLPRDDSTRTCTVMPTPSMRERWKHSCHDCATSRGKWGLACAEAEPKALIDNHHIDTMTVLITPIRGRKVLPNFQGDWQIAEGVATRIQRQQTHTWFGTDMHVHTVCNTHHRQLQMSCHDAMRAAHYIQTTTVVASLL